MATYSSAGTISLISHSSKVTLKVILNNLRFANDIDALDEEQQELEALVESQQKLHKV